MATRIAVIEDEPALRDNLRDALTRHGYEVQTFAGRPAAQQALAARLPDLAIIDVGLGDEPEGGFELCRWLRARAAALPILILSARDSEIDMVSGLRLGADDYVAKNVSLPHLQARVTALLRRAAASPQAEAFIQSLGLAGVDGTVARMRERNGASPALGNAWLKTGSLRDVAAVAGYVNGRSGQRYSLVALINHDNAGAARAALDLLVDWVAQEP